MRRFIYTLLLLPSMAAAQYNPPPVPLPGVTSVNGQAGAVTLTTANLQGVYNFGTSGGSALPACNAAYLGVDQFVNDVDGDTNVRLQCKYSNHRAAYFWATPSGRAVISLQTVPMAVAPTGTMANNGAITLGTALDQTYSGGIYLCLPASAISAGSRASCWYAVMSSTTVGTVYNNPYWYSFATLPNAGSWTGGPLWVNDCNSTTNCTAGAGSALSSMAVVNGAWTSVGYSQPPIVPASPTAFVTTGPGAFTGLTTLVQMDAVAVQGGLMGPQGQLDLNVNWVVSNSVNTKTFGTGWQANPSNASGGVATATATTTVGYQSALHVRNLESAAAQIIWQSLSGTGSSGVSYKTNATSSETVAFHVCTMTTATDYCIVQESDSWLVTP